MTDRISPALTPKEWADVLAVGAYAKDVDLLREEARCCRDHWNQRLAALFFDELADRIAALLPPETPA